jgi:hypothetical protein
VVVAAAALFLCGVLGAAGAAELKTEKQARAAAVRVLKGDPYGDTETEVLANLREVVKTTRGATPCGGGAGPVWSIHVVVAAPHGDPESPIDGRLVLDARSGAMVCAGLPFLD